MPEPANRPRRSRQPLIAFPYPHFMAFAPLDVWARLLFFPMVWVPIRYWLRLGFALFSSFLGTVGSLPERLLMAPILRLAAARSGMRIRHKPGVVVILGYFRSGTTHLHYLMSCDPRFRTPAWSETLAPQGFRFSWLFLRLFMIPWISSKRPQDDMAIGPSWPAEDDFALNNWGAASSLPWRFVFPSRYAHYSRFHSLEGLSERELKRWRSLQFAFCWKMARLAGGGPRGRTILLKSPSHTARVRALLELFGTDGVKFVHISRDPVAVIKSNIAMFRRMSIFGLEDPASDEQTRLRIEQEYVHSEQHYLRDLTSIPSGHIAEIRYEDLIADPLGQLRRVYGELSIPFTAEFEEHALGYLQSVRDYRAVGGAKKEPEETPLQPELAHELGRITTRFGHDRPPVAAASLPPRDESAQRPREKSAAVWACVAAMVAATAWLAEGYVLRNRNNWLIWPAGFLIGLVTIRIARIGTRRLGVLAAVLTFLVFAGVALPISFLADYVHRPGYHLPEGGLIPMKEWEWFHIRKEARFQFFATHNIFWGFMGCVTAYRFASRKHVRPPGGV